MLEEVRPEMRALIFFMIGLSMLGIGLLLGQQLAVIGLIHP